MVVLHTIPETIVFPFDHSITVNQYFENNLWGSILSKHILTYSNYKYKAIQKTWIYFQWFLVKHDPAIFYKLGSGGCFGITSFMWHKAVIDEGLHILLPISEMVLYVCKASVLNIFLTNSSGVLHIHCMLLSEEKHLILFGPYSASITCCKIFNWKEKLKSNVSHI